MAYPASTQTLDAWLSKVDSVASSLKFSAQRLHTRSAAGTADMELIRRFFDELVDANNLFIAVAAVPGIVQYAKDQKEDPSLNPVTEFNAMAAEVVTTLDWIRTNAPSDNFGGSSYYLTFDLPTGNTTRSSVLTFTAAQTTALRTQLDALIATIG